MMAVFIRGSFLPMIKLATNNSLLIFGDIKFEMEQGSHNQQRQKKCMQMLDELLSRVRATVQSKYDSDFLHKYRCHFQISQPHILVGGQLKKYQLEALEWMINLASQDSNGILADDMGLGKTIQAISYLAYLKEEQGILGKHLIVCPKSVAGNWARELAKWLPSAKVALMIIDIKTREAFLKDVLRARKFDIIITNYEGAKNNIGPLSRIKWETLIIDEAHKIKNNQSQNFMCLNYLKTTFRLLLTGTPLNNNLQELWALLNFIMPDIFHDENMFLEIEQSIKGFSGSEEEKLKFQCRVAKHFHEIISPFFKRRTKKELDLGLPEKKEMTLFVPLSKLQLRLYRNFLRFGNVFGVEPANYNIMTPRKICQHPYLFEGVEEEGEDLIEDSGKLSVLDKLLTKLISEKHKILIFSQFVMMLDVLSDYLDKKLIRYCRIDGSNSLQERDGSVKRFYDDPNYPIFLLSTRSGGLGLNLVAADRVIIYDIDWNPQNDLQATDRAYRIGQTRDVLVYRLVTEHSIEERMLEFQKYKLIWDELVIQKGAMFSRSKEDPFSNLNLNHLSKLGKGDIFRLEAESRDQTIEEILKMGEEKNKQKEAEIREKLKHHLEAQSKINPFEEEEEDDDTDTGAQDDVFIQRRNYDNQKRERAKFERNGELLPAFKFYVQQQQIKDIMFEIHMENKRAIGSPNKKLLQLLYGKLQEAQQKGRFHNWSEHEFQNFIKAHQTCRKTNYAGIAKFIGSKTEEEVKAYSMHFFEKAPNNERLVGHLKEIQKLQSKLKKDEGQKKEGEFPEVKQISNSLSQSADTSKKNEEESSHSEGSIATEYKTTKPSKRTKEEIQQAKEEKERIKQEREKAKQEEKEAREKKREEQIKRREEKREEQIKKKEENKIKREEEAKARAAAKQAKEEERVKKKLEKEAKRQKDLEELERKRIQSETKEKLQEADKVTKSSKPSKQAQEKSPSKRTEKSGKKIRKSEDSVETKSLGASMKKLPIVTIHNAS